MRHLFRRLHSYVLPASTDVSIPAFLRLQTALVSVLLIRVQLGTVVTAALAVTPELGGAAVPGSALWALVTVTVADRSVISYQRLRRR